MLNLLGCSKNNFEKLIQKMGYKTFKKDEEIYFSYTSPKRTKRSINNKKLKESPFEILKNLNIN